VIFLLSAPIYAAEIYITQTTSGGDTGADCANAHSAAWFDINAVGGNTYHLCSTFTGTANTTMLTIPVSGTAGNILEIKFETGAILTAPYWSTNGAIYGNAKNYITVDGGTNGIIRNTANGTSLANQQPSSGLLMSGSNLIIKNLTISNIYVNEGYTDEDVDQGGASSHGIDVISNGTGTVAVNNNTINGARIGIVFDFSSTGGQNVSIYSNTITEMCWGMYVTANDDANVTISNFNIYGNNISDWRRWAYPDISYHQDGIFISGYGTVTNTGINIYKNYIHGLAGGSVTASIYCTFDGTLLPGPVCNIYNNLLTTDATLGGTGLIGLAGGKTYYVYNNTFYGDGTGQAIYPGNADTIVNMGNNLISGYSRAIIGGNAGWSILANYNFYYNLTTEGWKWEDGAATYATLALWQAAGYDVNGYGITTDPLMVSPATGNFRLQVTSTAKDVGTATITPLTYADDYAGVSRPQGAAWDIGAYEYFIKSSIQGVQITGGSIH
jgi:hypothetical protein